MNSHETQVDVWSRVLLAIALLLLVNQVQLVSPVSSDSWALIPSVSSALKEVPRYPQSAPALDNALQNWTLPAPQSPSVASRQGSWVF